MEEKEKKVNKKLILIISLSIVAVILVFLVVMEAISFNNIKKEVEKDNSNNVIAENEEEENGTNNNEVAKKEEINYEEVFVHHEFEELEEPYYFYDGEKVVYIKHYPDAEPFRASLLDSETDEVLLTVESYLFPMYNSDNNEFLSLAYSSDPFNTFGLINSDYELSGEIYSTPTNDICCQMIPSTIRINNSKYLVISKNEKNVSEEKYGLIDMDSNIILEFKYDDIVVSQDAENAIVVNDGETYLVDLENDLKTSAVYDELYFDESTEYIIAKKDGKFGVIDKYEKVILDFDYGFIDFTEEVDLILVEKDGLFQILNMEYENILKDEIELGDELEEIADYVHSDIRKCSLLMYHSKRYLEKSSDDSYILKNPDFSEDYAGAVPNLITEGVSIEIDLNNNIAKEYIED